MTSSPESSDGEFIDLGVDVTKMSFEELRTTEDPRILAAAQRALDQTLARSPEEDIITD